jgi:hypothetical protein
VSSFAFVEATGPIYAGKLVKDALNMAPNKAPGGPAPRLDPALDTGAMVDAAETILRAMSLTSNSRGSWSLRVMARTWSTTRLPAVCIAAPAAAIPAR